MGGRAASRGGGGGGFGGGQGFEDFDPNEIFNMFFGGFGGGGQRSAPPLNPGLLSLPSGDPYIYDGRVFFQQACCAFRQGEAL